MPARSAPGSAVAVRTAGACPRPIRASTTRAARICSRPARFRLLSTTSSVNLRSFGAGDVSGSPTDASAPTVITVAIIEDNRLAREGLTILLNRISGIRVVAGGASADAVLSREKLDPRVVLLDVGLRNGDSLRVARRMKRELPDARIVVMDLLPVQEEIVELVHAGVSGFLMQDATLDDLERTIRSVAAGGDVLPPQMIGSLFSQIARDAVARGVPAVVDDVRMTPRERQVILLIAEGLSNKEIAARLHIAIHTVKSHVRHVMEKLTLRTRLQIAAYVREQDRDKALT